ncbi:MAG: glycosyltransferase family 4 protein [Anaerolineae bacterium]|jgi:glycosyltransferase involved in cell wall biosynthesis|nr:glycosyltransferase family 4 protein [Anaerolineae bacterium]
MSATHKILRVISRLNVGGPAIHVSLLTEKLNAPDYPLYHSLLVSGTIGNEEGDMSYYATQHGVEPIYLPELGRSLHPVRDLLTLWKLIRLIRRERPTIVHTHTSKAGFIGRVAARLCGVPVIVHTYHGHVFSGYFGPLKNRLFILLDQITARFSDAILALTQGQRRDLSEVYRIAPKERITVLPLGLDLAPFAAFGRKRGVFREQWQIPPDAPLIGIVGRFVPIKNHHLFLESAAILCRQHPEARFVLVGDGELRPEIETTIDTLGLRDRVIITGWLRDLPTVYSDLDVFVISSNNEGTPVTMIEALSAGCPVVSTAVGGIPDLLDGGELGRLVPADDATALAQAIDETLDHPVIDAQKGSEAMLHRYGIGRLVQDLDSLYRGLLKHKGRG